MLLQQQPQQPRQKKKRNKKKKKKLMHDNDNEKKQDAAAASAAKARANDTDDADIRRIPCHSQYNHIGMNMKFYLTCLILPGPIKSLSLSHTHMLRMYGHAESEQSTSGHQSLN